MFDIGFLELVVILVLALLVLGPERLPKAARSVGYWFGKARRYVEGIKTQVEAEFDSTEVKRLLRNQEVQIRELQNKLQNTDDYINTDYHSQFGDVEDPNTDALMNDPSDVSKDGKPVGVEEKPAGPQYDIIEEDDERWDGLVESNRVVADVAQDAEIADEKVTEKVTGKEPGKSQEKTHE